MLAENLRPMALIITLFCVAYIVAAMTGVAAQLYFFAAYSQDAATLRPLEIASWGAFVSHIIFLATVIPVLIWIYMAHDNLRKERLSGLNYSPAWAAFSFFVPFLNLYVPFAAMRELANRSAGEPEELAGAEVDTALSWWGSWVGGMILWTIVEAVLYVDSIEGVWVTTPFWATQGLAVLALILLSISAFFLIKLVRIIGRDQLSGATRIGVFD